MISISNFSNFKAKSYWLLPRVGTIVGLLSLTYTFSTMVMADTSPSTDNSQLMASRPGYSTDPFDMNVTTLPASFKGNDPLAAWVNVVRLLEITKDEFETTDQFNARLARNQDAPVVGTLTVQSQYAFEVDPSSITTSYDADKGQMTVTLDFIQAIAAFNTGHHDTLEVFSVEKNMQLVDETNGFGAQIQVAKADEQTVNISIANMKDFKLKMKYGDDSDTSDDKTDIVIPMDVDTAKAAKPDITILAACHLVKNNGHYAAVFTGETTPTTDRPFDFNNTDAYFAVNLDRLYVYDSITGKILYQLAPVGSK